ncbi:MULTISPECIES: glycosyltransferase family 4 protein [Nostocales]|jgi:glycosyltransferase involved in cell wall biosynthesis|uniref:Glycosyltransferase family 4 protein n=1 Tax=Dolichospermum flos-aquae UHCC 0037 TaxID=2590026 RepID=A0ACC7S243_DOLFA|nr:MULTISPECIES: glycosyltransferase family 4 protein [Nostocales]ALB39809.1 glycosyltransferase [Anabaena sp. WA102]MBO1063855.1 glycosyltransferase family 4 protein [Anabaena sp. 54]MTJ42520.1 glycosyltransferase family 4 protein [Dolichospermum flos-aquae UHCC 0037]
MSNQKGYIIPSLHSIEAEQPSKISDILCRKLTTLSVITEFFPPDYAATGQLIEELVKQLEKQGIKIRVFTGQPGYAFTTAQAPALEQLGNVRVQRSRSTQVWSNRIRGKAVNGVLFTLRVFLHIIRNAGKNDVFLLTSAPPFLSIAGYLTHLFLKFPYVCLIYDLYPDIAIALGVVSHKHWLAKFWWAINRQIWQKSTGIIVLSPAMKERVLAICPEVADKVSVIHSWGDPELIVPIAKEKNWFAKQHNLDSIFTILYSGNMGRCHDTDTILATAKQLQNEEIQFVCIGGGPKRESFIQDVKRLGLKNFLFLPYQEKSVLPYSLTACDLSLVSVELGLESLVAPSKLYPALAAGRPIAAICPKDSYLRQLITDGQFGISIDNGDSDSLSKFILNLKSDRQLAEKMGNASREYLQSNFTPEIIAKQYINVLEKSIT